MHKTIVLARKDVSSYFYSWLGVFLFTFFYLMCGILFAMLVASYSRISDEAIQNAYRGVEGMSMTHFVFSSMFLNVGVIVIFFVPLISMRAFSEERRHQTLELLFTYPLSDFQIVFGKFLGLFWFFCLLVLPTLGYILLFQWLGGHIEWGPILTSYLGIFLLGGAFLSLGLYISSLTENQVISALVTFGLLGVFWSFEWIAGMSDGAWSKWVQLISPLTQYREFTFGILDLGHIAYFCFFGLYFLFLTLRSIETRNWKA